MYLKEFIKHILKESIQTNFDLEKFKNLPFEEQIIYAQKLPYIAEGAGRIVYDFGNGKVLKVAKTKEGFANGIQQNKQELKLYTKLYKIRVVPEIYDYDPEFKWILVEKVNVLNDNNKNEIQNYTGLYWDEMETVFYELVGLYTPEQILNPQKYPDVKDEIEEITDFGSPWRQNKNIQRLFKAIKAGVGNEEILVPSHLGIRSNGDVVLVDYGF